MDRFIKDTNSSNAIMDSCNDLLLVHVRNVCQTPNKSGYAKFQSLEDEKTIVSIFARSKGHCIKMIRALIMSQIQEDKDNSCNNEIGEKILNAIIFVQWKIMMQ